MGCTGLEKYVIILSTGVLLDPERFGTTILLTATSRYLATAVYNLCVEFGWNQFVFLYSQYNDNGKCFTMQNDFLVGKIWL